IAIHKAGAAYVPIDLEYPEERQQYMLSDSEAKVVIDSQFIAETDFSQDATSIDLSTADGLAYMIYTSGSTGRPKGVMIRQRGLSSYISSMVDVHGISSEDRISVYFPFAFDGHVMDLYPALTQGGSVHIVPSAIRRDLRAIKNFIMEHGITGGCFIPSIGTLLIENGPLPLRYMDMGGERMVGLVSKDVQLINCYGPTECTNMISAYLLERGRTYSNIPIGRPLANCQCFIVDTNNRMVPRGVAGELCIAGIQVGVGYWKRPELTAEKFVPCPFLSSSQDGMPVRMYHTGDLCRWNDEHQLEFLGRTDEQVKLRGYRIELGEIESCANSYKGIRQAVAAVREIAGSSSLCLYYTTDGSAVDTDGLRQFLGLTLAAYMVPTAYMQLDALPLTPNGKVDRRRLPAIEQSLQHTDYVAPRNELEKLIVSGFEKVLNQEKISVNDDFVLLGGDSLDALKVVFSLGKSGITVADILSLRTPAAIASNAKGFSDYQNRYSVEGGCPLNNTQLFIYQDIIKFNKYDSYLIPFLIPIDSKYTDEQIRDALDAVFTAHPVLTMHVAIRDGVPYMEKGDKPAVIKGSLNPLKNLSLMTSGFDLYSSLSRHIIVRIPGRCYLLSVIHHLIFDRISLNVFYRHFLRTL
ncbi:MAG: amino acid adenylation domain-containing protein, partial [Bacteroidaceae bacterium]|nr:amino acid adenylation domain-containing protein [Bacteroidaceae bacterium]